VVYIQFDIKVIHNIPRKERIFDMNQQRLEAERLVYRIMDILDPEGRNTDFWKEQFSKMNDNEFKDYISGHYPFYFQTGAFKEPKISQIKAALDELGVPMLESVYLPYKYKDSNGRPMKTKPCLVIYIHMKRMKQILTKKNGYSIFTETRDMRTGLLSGRDKNGKESDREFESLAVSGLDATTQELSRSRADSMNDKAIMSNTIKSLGQVSLKDLPEEVDDSLSKNLLSTYLIGAQLVSPNLVMQGYLLPYTVKGRKMKLNRVD
jgi:hypothetical protein